MAELHPERAARYCLKLTKTTTFPVDTIKVANALGLIVYSRGAEDDPYPYSGRLCLREKCEIEFNQAEHIVRQRTIVAHLLGHCLLGHENAPPEEGAFYARTEPFEKAAMLFAKELVMPAEEVRRVWNEYTGESVGRMSTRFGVSCDAFGYRLLELRLV